uniref:Uncharacterized protein n=1 Tax=Anopheles atroparvus TaxID=41427 RepID=A0A182IWV0_ANOAO
MGHRCPFLHHHHHHQQQSSASTEGSSADRSHGNKHTPAGASALALPAMPSLPLAAIDYDNRHQYRDHRKQQYHHRYHHHLLHSPCSYTTSLLQSPLRELLLLSTLLPAASLWTSRHHPDVILFLPISNSSEHSPSVKQEALAPSSTASSRREQPSGDAAAGARWSVKHKSLPSMVALSAHGEPKTISKFNFTSPTTPTTAAGNRWTMGERWQGSGGSLMGTRVPSFTAGATFESHLQFNEIIL